MKCQDFETTIYRLAHGQLVEAAERSHALLHIEQCARCTNVFAEQRAVACRVHAVAVSLADESASAQVEARLRHAFRERASLKTAPAISPLPARHSWEQLGRQRVLGVAIAAVILLALLLGLRWLRSPVTEPQPEVVHHDSAPATPAPEAKELPPVRIDKVNVIEQKRAERRQRRRAVGLDTTPETEVATDFYPLFKEGEIVPLESGKVIRVQMPASALIALGLPITAENSNLTVEADLVLGQDGLARAIRFLR